MRYFSYIAEQSFNTDAEGRRVFCLGGPFSRPYVVSDPTTESRLFRKLTWHYRIFLSALIIGQVFLLPQILAQPWRFFAFLGAIVALQWLILRLVFFTDLRALARAPARLSLRTFYTTTARRHSVRGLLLGLIGSLAFVAAGVATLFAGDGLFAVGVTLIVLLGTSAVAWGYALRLKLAQNGEQLR